MTYPCRNAEESYQSLLTKKNAKPVKRSNIITQQSKSIEYPKIVDIKLNTIEQSKTCHELFKAG